MIPHPFLLVAISLFMVVAVAQAEQPAATPYRPTVSNPAVLPVPGMAEIELGGQYSSGGTEKRSGGLPFLAKYAFNSSWGVLVGADLYTHVVSVDDETEQGFGDTLLTLKHHHAILENLAVGFEASVNMPTAKQALAGGYDGTLNGIVSTNLGEASVDFNLGVTRLQTYDSGDNRYLVSWAAAIAQPIAERWTLSGEMSGADRKGTRGVAQFLGSLSYELNPRVILDGGFTVGMGSTAQDWSLFTGVTMLLGN